MYFRISATNLDNVGKLVHVQLGRHEEENDFSGNHQLRMCVGFVSLDEMVNPEYFSHAKECQVGVVLSVLGCLGFPFFQLWMNMFHLERQAMCSVQCIYFNQACRRKTLAQNAMLFADNGSVTSPSVVKVILARSTFVYVCHLKSWKTSTIKLYLLPPLGKRPMYCMGVFFQNSVYIHSGQDTWAPDSSLRDPLYPNKDRVLETHTDEQ